MSWFDDLLDYGSQALDWFTGNSVGASIARTASTGYALNRVTNSINKTESKSTTTAAAAKDTGVRVQVNPDTEYKVPVVYGTATLGGAITDAYLTDDHQTMYYVITICEKTGYTNLGQGAASTFTFKKIFWDDNQLVFGSDGVSVTGWIDRTGVLSNAIGGQIKVYCYAGSSTLGVKPAGFTGPIPNAYAVMPGWTSLHNMNDLVFAIVQVTYSREKSVTGLGNMRFQIQNSMTNPGDCLYDYMTNTRYGAGIAPSEINSL